jgi:histone deacetylase 1/2
LWIYLLKKKSDVFQTFHNFQKLVERQFDKKILVVQSDWGGEYEKLNSFFKKIGIEHHVFCPHAHQQNGSAERKHRHIVEVGLALLANASLPLKFWDEDLLTATYLINMLPSKVIDHETPIGVFLKKHLIMHLSVLLVVRAGPTFVLSTSANLLFVQNNVLSLVIAPCIKV